MTSISWHKALVNTANNNNNKNRNQVERVNRGSGRGAKEKRGYPGYPDVGEAGDTRATRTRDTPPHKYLTQGILLGFPDSKMKWFFERYIDLDTKYRRFLKTKAKLRRKCPILVILFYAGNAQQPKRGHVNKKFKISFFCSTRHSQGLTYPVDPKTSNGPENNNFLGIKN